MLIIATVTSCQLLRLEGALSQEGGRRLDNAAIAQAVDLDRGHLEGRTSVLVLGRLVYPQGPET